MAGNPDGEVPARQDVSSSGDAYVAGRDLDVHHNPQVQVSGSYGVQVGGHNVLVNYFIDQGVGLRPTAASAGGTPAGRPLEKVTDPFAFEVHRPVQAQEPQLGLPALPAYVPRPHDGELAEVVRAAAEGTSGMAVLVGGSSTGKTRACWEALGLLRERPEGWRLWHPIDPEAALRELGLIGPRTVIWLNEAQSYLAPADAGLGERIAAGLRELLRDPGRAPVLVLAALWPQYWIDLTARPAAGTDPHAQARELLAARDIAVPTAFTADQLPLLTAAGDPRPGPGPPRPRAGGPSSSWPGHRNCSPATATRSRPLRR
ncbi:MAG: hypothetical protein JWM19_7610 [Actinomycetia bacterium]|nr:hypothetical protein [Actinomycetes bacterium]